MTMAEYLPSPESPKRIEVPQGEWRELQGEGVLHTVGVSTCVGVSVYDADRRHAVLGHFDLQTQSDPSRFNAMMQAANQLIKQGNAQVFLWGGSLTDPEAGYLDELPEDELKKLPETERREIMHIQEDLSKLPDSDRRETVRIQNNQTGLLKNEIAGTFAQYADAGLLVSFGHQWQVMDYELNVGTGETPLTPKQA